MSSKKSNELLDPQKVGERLRSERERMGWTQKEMARRLGLKSDVAVNTYEAGRVPRARILVRYGVFFGRPLEWILAGRASLSDFKIAEPEEEYGNPQRMSLVKAVKRFATEADDDLVRALLENVKAFKELMERRKGLKGE